jgi:hypothetical protein
MAVPSQHVGRGTAWRAFALTAVAALLMPAAALSQGAEAEPLPEPGTALEPGRYVSSAVGPSIAFRAEEGWIVGPSGSGPIFTLERADQPGTVLSVTRFDGDVFLDSCDPSSLTVVEATVPRLLEVIGGNPYLNPGPPAQTAVDGYEGLWMDVAIPAYEECDLPWLLLWALPMAEGGEFVQVADQQSRFIALDVDGGVIVVAIESFPGVPFGGLLEASLELVDSMRITPGAYVPPEPSASPTAEPSDEPAAAIPVAEPSPSPAA